MKMMASVRILDTLAENSAFHAESENAGSSAPNGVWGVKYTDTESGFRGVGVCDWIRFFSAINLLAYVSVFECFVATIGEVHQFTNINTFSTCMLVKLLLHQLEQQ